ncbi:MAG: hypothetical protein V1809_00080 [Planctomycetota bacterium]
MSEAPNVQPLASDAPKIVAAIGTKSVALYVQIRAQYLQGDVHENRFRHDFQLFYRLNNAGLTPEFKTRYFDLMDAARADALDLGAIAMELFEFRNRKGQQSLQFSFVTKLANIVDPTCPIYDSLVAALFGFRPPLSGIDVGTRLDRLMRFHDWLRSSYDGIIKSGTMSEVFDLFRHTYSVSAEAVPDTKVVDFVCWTAGRMRLKLDGWCP